MPVTPKVVIEIDDNTPADAAPFTNDVSMWSFSDDFNLGTRTASDTLRKLHELVDASKFRGYPERAAQGTRELFDGLVDSSEVTWIAASELPRDRCWLPAGSGAVECTLRALFETVDVVSLHFGADRVRLVFAFV
jgi:hypothetical protein